MKFLYLHIVFFFVAVCGYAQVNLVPNPSFENFSSCPDDLSQITRAVGWLSFTDSPDYYNKCDTNSNHWASVPFNAAGYQQAYDGNAYAGEILCGPQDGVNAREYMGIQLTQTLVIGQKYYVSFMASLNEISYFGGFECFSNKLGAKFTTYSYTATAGNALTTNSAQIYSDSLLKDTLGWVQIRGSFIADSAYKYIVLGNFFDDAHTDTVQCPSRAYSFIDMVCVSTDSLTCYAQLGTGNFLNEANFEILPNPASETLIIKTPFDSCALSALGLLGQKILFPDFRKNAQLDISSLPNGLYIFSIQTKQKSYSKKIIINH